MVGVVRGPGQPDWSSSTVTAGTPRGARPSFCCSSNATYARSPSPTRRACPACDTDVSQADPPAERAFDPAGLGEVDPAAVISLCQMVAYGSSGVRIFVSSAEQGVLFLRVETGEQPGGVQPRSERPPQFVSLLGEDQGALAPVGGMRLTLRRYPCSGACRRRDSPWKGRSAGGPPHPASSVARFPGRAPTACGRRRPGPRTRRAPGPRPRRRRFPTPPAHGRSRPSARRPQCAESSVPPRSRPTVMTASDSLRVSTRDSMILKAMTLDGRARQPRRCRATGETVTGPATARIADYGSRK